MASITTTEPVIDVPGSGAVDSVLMLPADAQALYVLAHGAGAPMRHAFMQAIAGALGERGIGTLRYNFPYTQAGRRSPDRPPVLEATVRAAIEAAVGLADGLPVFAGGKSMGGRMTSQALAASADGRVRGVVFLGFPLHGVGKPPGTERAAHLEGVAQPMLFVQGTRDSLADLKLMRGVVAELGSRASMHVVEDGDHGFHVRKKSGRDDTAVIEEIADAVSAWMTDVVGRS